MHFEKRLDELNLIGERWRERVFAPLLRLCRKLHISATQITVFRVLLAAVYVALIARFPDIALICIIVSILLDTVDGAVARFLRTDSDRGKFIDVLSDQLTFVLLCLGLIRILPELARPIAAAMATIPLVYLMAMIATNERRSSGWIIKTQARMTTYKALFILVIAGLFWSWWPHIIAKQLIWILAVTAGVHFSKHFYMFARRGPSHL